MNDLKKNFLSFSNTEQRGIISLVLLILFVFLGQALYTRYMAKQQFELQYSLLSSTSETEQLAACQQEKPRDESNALPFPFDPNTASHEDFIELGLSEKVAQTIINYRDKGGVFYSSSDLQKIYGLEPDEFERLAPFISIPKNKFSQPNTESYSSANASHTTENSAIYPKKEYKVIIDLNAADSSMLTSLKGIGPVYASRIIKYRKMLGGFHEKNQLMEVYGISPEVYESIEGQLVCEAIVKPIKVHDANWVDLKSHPYISGDLANLILHYIQSHGRMDSLGILLDLDIIEKDDYYRLKPYLSFE